MVICPDGDLAGLPGEAAREPAFGLPAIWIDRSLRDEAAFRGMTVVDASTVITTHVTEVLKDNIADLFSYAETQKLRSEEHTSELQSLMRNSYAVFCLKQKITATNHSIYYKTRHDQHKQHAINT